MSVEEYKTFTGASHSYDGLVKKSEEEYKNIPVLVIVMMAW